MNHREELNEAIEEIKHALRGIWILQLRVIQFQKELDYYNKNKENLESNPVEIGKLMRLSDELRLLCIDTYSLHEGIAKKQSLYSKVIKQKAQVLSKVDKSPVENIRVLVFDGEEGPREASEKDKKSIQKVVDKLAHEEREKSRNSYGITSTNHSDLDRWLENKVDEKLIEDLKNCRSEFAHWLDSLENLERALTYFPPDFIEKVLNDISKVLCSHEFYLKKIILYTTSVDYDGINLIYSSLAREI